jgi:hypothetical protein
MKISSLFNHVVRNRQTTFRTTGLRTGVLRPIDGRRPPPRTVSVAERGGSRQQTTLAKQHQRLLKLKPGAVWPGQPCTACGTGSWLSTTGNCPDCDHELHRRTSHPAYIAHFRWVLPSGSA